MSIQKKKGFTLIELMVVIVIIGILAAIAIPKLFGMTAKAKASEVGPAVGTWSKLQQAYVMDASTLGSFVKIGYTPPGESTSSGGNKTSSTDNFTYSGTPSGEGSAAVGATATWSAAARQKLGDCKVENGKWSASISMNTAGDESNKPTGHIPDDNDCSALTPNFDKLQ